MASGLVGHEVRERFRTGVEGQTLAADAAATVDPNGDAWTPTVSNPSSDTYEVAFTPDAAGVWVAELTDGVGRRYRSEYDILAAPSTTFTRVAAGQRIRSAHFNAMQQRLEELPF